MALPRSFDITDVRYQSIGKDARYGLVTLTVAPRTGVSPKSLDVAVYLLDERGFPIGFAGRSKLEKWQDVEFNPSIGTIGCPASLLERMLVLLKWDNQTAYEGHYVRFEHKRPQQPCPTPSDD